MKFFIRDWFVNACSLLIISYLYVGLKVTGGLKTFILAGLVITLINLTVKPLLKLLFLPINLLTLGLFRWVINVVCLFLLEILVAGVDFSGFDFGGFSYGGIAVSPIRISLFVSLVISSFLLSLIVEFFDWVFGD